MSLQEIEKRIIKEADAEASKIKEQAEQSIQHLETVNTRKKEEARREIMKQAQQKAEDVKRSILVPARLKANKSILEEKQKILEKIYDEIQKKRKISDAEIKKIREDTEVKIGSILFQ